MKLRTKIQMYSTLVVFIVILLINTAIFYLFYKISIDAEIERVKSETNTIMEALADNMDTTISPNDLMKAYIPSNGMIQIINQEDQVIHSIRKDAEFFDLPSDYVSAETSQVIEGEDGVRSVMVSVPIIWEDGEVVTLQVTEKLSSLDETMSTLFYVLLFASLIMVIPTIIGSHFLSNFLLKPIQQLTKTMTDNPKKGEWRTINISGRSKDELYQMGSTYNRMIERLKESFHKQEQFVSDASHELKTPLSVIKSYTQLLERWGKSRPEVFDEATHAINTETERMSYMIQQMLDLAKNEQKENLQFEHVNLIPMLQDCIRAFTVTYKRKIKFSSDFDQLELSCDREKMNQLFYILIDNACKYSQEDVNVTVDHVDGLVKVDIQDFGEGIAEQDVERIFDRFYRVDKARSRETGGTGLGLPIAQFIARSHGGEISVVSEEGNGTVFTVSIPH
ncbi:HAMP domain-containing sensor histidine kinase [Salinibacillus xinjiangensis]|uniref:Signal transduction histidine-protein kinase ArlS n=1 Tax=Salinibacillus xinjiangensis TaxID=1229268 RepID=A0A6G1X8K1_9BACI|nr:HAMP domain-containing sensor histidine kinase [Salinibacillus xinjiangensis]MRG87333.1 HAMP domain-containing protein [Salinibacillus xinjiangensis]